MKNATYICNRLISVTLLSPSGTDSEFTFSSFWDAEKEFAAKITIKVRKECFRKGGYTYLEQRQTLLGWEKMVLTCWHCGHLTSMKNDSGP